MRWELLAQVEDVADCFYFYSPTAKEMISQNGTVQTALPHPWRLIEECGGVRRFLLATKEHNCEPGTETLLLL